MIDDGTLALAPLADAIGLELDALLRHVKAARKAAAAHRDAHDAAGRSTVDHRPPRTAFKGLPPWAYGSVVPPSYQNAGEGSDG